MQRDLSFFGLRAASLTLLSFLMLEAQANPKCAPQPEAQPCEGNCQVSTLSVVSQKDEIEDLVKALQPSTAVKIHATQATSTGIRALPSKNNLHFDAETEPDDELPIFDIDPSKQFQSLDGFGAALSESCSMNIMKLSPEKRQEVLEKLFSKTKGAGLDRIRLPVGASDFADATQGSYSYNDTKSNRPDPKFKNFNMSRDEKSFEIIRDALKINPNIKVMISPWSAPAWMKEPKNLKGGKLSPKHYQDYANYFVKVLREYQKRGIPVESLTIQNEPGYATKNYPSMGMNPKEQMTFISKHLGPTLERAKIPTRIFAHDHNWDMVDHSVTPMLDNKATRKYIGGVAYHCYAGSRWQMTNSMKKHPQIPTMQTECTGSISSDHQGDFHWWLDTQSLGSVKMGTTGALGWNLCLDEKGGPQNGGCSQCRGLMTIDFSKSEPELIGNPELAALAQISRFIQPGSRRIEVSGPKVGNPDATGFINADGSMVFAAHNPTKKAVRFQVRDPDCRILTYELPANTAVTLTWGEAKKNEI